jgi:hypothetical protein
MLVCRIRKVGHWYATSRKDTPTSVGPKRRVPSRQRRWQRLHTLQNQLASLTAKNLTHVSQPCGGRPGSYTSLCCPPSTPPAGVRYTAEGSLPFPERTTRYRPRAQGIVLGHPAAPWSSAWWGRREFPWAAAATVFASSATRKWPRRHRWLALHPPMPCANWLTHRYFLPSPSPSLGAVGAKIILSGSCKCFSKDSRKIGLCWRPPCLNLPNQRVGTGVRNCP